MEKLASLDRWVKERYLVLERVFRDKPFTMKEAEEALISNGIEPGNLKALMSELQKAKLVKVQKSALDERYSIYQIVKPPVRPNLGELESLLKTLADLIRGGLDYKVLPLLLFYKAVSDRYINEVREYLKLGMGEKEAYMIANQNFRLYDEANDKLLTWHEIVKSKEKIKDLANAIKRIAELNSSDETFRKIGSLVDVVGLTGFLNEENLHTIYSIIEKLSEVDLSKLDYDALGHAYQWILRYFAPQKAKEGEVYTPHEVIKLIIRLIDPEEGSTIADPAAGSGAMLIEAYRYVKTKTGKDSVTLKLLGKERNETTAALAVMNMVINGIKDYKIYIGDSLINPRLNGEADYVVANPPWNQDGYGEEKLNTPDLRKVYKYGFPPGNTADWAWIQLMIHLAKKKVGVVIDQGALFREGKELNIRKGIVEEDLIEAIVLLPEKLFYNTQAAGIVIILNKQKPPERKGKILFINATNEYEKHPEVKKLNRLTDKGIEKIVDAYRKFEDIAGFARVVTIEEIRKNNYNLNVPLYITPLEEKQDIDLGKEWAQLQELRAKETELWTKVEHFINEVMRL